jgi:hypothetical protein
MTKENQSALLSAFSAAGYEQKSFAASENYVSDGMTPMAIVSADGKITKRETVVITLIKDTVLTVSAAT